MQLFSVKPPHPSMYSPHEMACLSFLEVLSHEIGRDFFQGRIKIEERKGEKGHSKSVEGRDSLGRCYGTASGPIIVGSDNNSDCPVMG